MSTTRFRAALAAALFATPVAGAATSAPQAVLPFIEDDYPRALAAAKAERKPIFFEAWAPW